MKKLLFASVLLAAVSFTSSCAQDAKPLASPRAYAESKNVKLNYGQPSKRGRVIFGELVPYGQVWRAGANEATEITFAKDATFGGKPIKAGTYTLFIRPEKDKWTIILNSQLKQFGAFDYDKYKDKDVLTVDVPVKATSSVIEKLTYRFPDANNLIIEWDKTQVTIPIKAS
jgi:hypothetical protein